MCACRDGPYLLQTDKRWSGMLVYAPGVDRALDRLTDELHRRRRGEARNSRAVHRALRAFGREVRRASKPERPCPQSRGSIRWSGCHLVSLTNLLRRFGVPLDGEEPTPPLLLEALRYESLMTLTGYCLVPDAVDHLSILTGACVQLVAAEDHGRSGVRPSRSAILRTGLSRSTAALVCTGTHGHFGGGTYSHWLLVLRRMRGNFEVADPADAKRTLLLPASRKVFAVHLYRRVPRRKRR